MNKQVDIIIEIDLIKLCSVSNDTTIMRINEILCFQGIFYFGMV